MDNKLVLLVGITAGIAAAVYLLYQELQKQRLQIRDQNLQIRALIQQSKRVEGLIYTYNIDQLENDPNYINRRNTSRMLSSHIFPIENNNRDVLVAWSEEQLNNNNRGENDNVSRSRSHSNSEDSTSQSSDEDSDSHSTPAPTQNHSTSTQTSLNNRHRYHNITSTNRHRMIPPQIPSHLIQHPPSHLPSHLIQHPPSHLPSHLIQHPSSHLPSHLIQHSQIRSPLHMTQQSPQVNHERDSILVNSNGSQMNRREPFDIAGMVAEAINLSTNSNTIPRIFSHSFPPELLLNPSTTILYQQTTTPTPTLTSQSHNNESIKNIKSFDLDDNDEEDVASHSDDEKEINQPIQQPLHKEIKSVDDEQSNNVLTTLNDEDNKSSNNILTIDIDDNNKTSNDIDDESNDSYEDNKNVKVYKDTILNRKLGRVGLPIQKK